MSHWAYLRVSNKAQTTSLNAHEKNLTYNYQPAIAAAGLASFSLLSGKTGQEAEEVLASVLNNLDQHPEYGDLIRGGGEWGTLATLREAITDMLVASENWPEGIWEVS